MRPRQWVANGEEIAFVLTNVYSFHSREETEQMRASHGESKTLYPAAVSASVKLIYQGGQATTLHNAANPCFAPWPQLDPFAAAGQSLPGRDGSHDA